jgi:hypothetical protein
MDAGKTHRGALSAARFSHAIEMLAPCCFLNKIMLINLEELTIISHGDQFQG